MIEMNSLKRTILGGLFSLSLIGTSRGLDEKLDFGDVNGQVISTTLIEDDKYGLLCLLYVNNSDGVMSYHVLGGDSEYLREFVDDASQGTNVYLGKVGSRTIEFWGSYAPITDVDSVQLWK